MRNVVFVAPYPLETTMSFVAGLSSLDDVRMLGIFQKPPEGPAASAFADVALIPDVFDANLLTEAGKVLAQRHGRIHRFLGVLEELQVPLAIARTRLDVAGTSVETAHVFRDKGHMKDALRAAGIQVARHSRIRSDKDAWRFIEDVGFPIVMKPPAGAGCRATYRINHVQELVSALQEIHPSESREVLGEEFLTGQEYSFETLTIDGKVRFHSLGRYYPSPLEVMENDWIQWVVHMPKEIDGPEFDAVKAVGPKVIAALGLDSGMTHMEWFRRADGSVAVGEIAARPPGAQIVTLTGMVHDMDCVRQWARAVIDGAFDGPWERKYSAGVAFLRGAGIGRISGIDGLAEAQQRMGHLVVKAQLPRIGWNKSTSYEGDGWAIVRDTDSAVVKQALFDLITTVKVRYAS